jgi:predicted anti-sigma-YlaC factor YlaD
LARVTSVLGIGNRTGTPIDYLVVRCQTAREAISALLDGEDPGVEGWALDDHVLACADCRRWQSAAHAVTRNGRLGPARPVTVGSDELIAAVLAHSRPPRRPTSLTWARVCLVAVGVSQAAITAPLLIYGRDRTAPVHIAHEVGAFAMALAVGFLVAALKPDRARGMQALVGAAAALLVVTALLDLLNGRTDLGDEAPHLLAVLGWLLLVRVAAETPSTTVDSRWSLAPVVRAVTGRRAPVSEGASAQTRELAEGCATAPPGRRRAG